MKRLTASGVSIYGGKEMSGKMEDYIWTAAAVEKELELGQGRVARDRKSVV